MLTSSAEPMAPPADATQTAQLTNGQKYVRRMRDSFRASSQKTFVCQHHLILFSDKINGSAHLQAGAS